MRCPVPELNVPRVGMSGREGKGLVLAVPPASELHRAGRSHCVACCCGCKRASRQVPADFSSGALPPARLLQFSQIPHPQVLLFCALLLGAGVLRQAPSISSGWTKPARHPAGGQVRPQPSLASRTAPPNRHSLVARAMSTRVQHLVHFPLGPGSGLGPSQARVLHHVVAVAAAHVFSSAGKTPPLCQACRSRKVHCGFGSALSLSLARAGQRVTGGLCS